MLLLLALCGCERGEGAKDSAAAPADSGDGAGEEKEEAVPVDVAVLGLGPIESVIRASSNITAERQVQVMAEASRHVTGLLVEEGDRVKQGDVLVRLKDDEQRSTLARVTTLLEKAEREFERQQNLFERDLSSEEALNNARDELATQRLAHEDARRELSYTGVRTPISGMVTRRMVSLGNQVTVGQHLFDVVDFESLVAMVYVPEKNLKQVRVGQPVRVIARGVREEPYPATVDRVAPVVDPRTGTVKVTVAVGGQEGLRPGLYADVEIITDVRPEAILVPKRALVYDNDQVFVYRLGPERKVERIRVVPALSDQSWVVPAAGFAAGDTIVIAGQTGLKDGATVKLVGESRTGEELVGTGEAESASGNGTP